MEDTFKFKRKGNRIKFEFNLQILQIVQNLSLALSNSDTSEASDFCNDLTAKLKRRNKVLIRQIDQFLVGTLLRSTRLIQSLATQTMKRRSDKPRTGHLPNGKLKHLPNLPLAFLIRNHHASGFK